MVFDIGTPPRSGHCFGSCIFKNKVLRPLSLVPVYVYFDCMILYPCFRTLEETKYPINFCLLLITTAHKPIKNMLTHHKKSH